MSKKIFAVSIAVLLYSASGYGQQPGLLDKPTDSTQVRPPKPDRRAYMIEAHISILHGFATLDPGLPDFSYLRYIADRETYKASPSAREPYLSYIPACDSFFESGVPKLVAKEFDDVKKKFAELERVKEDSALTVPEKVKMIERVAGYLAGLLHPDSPMQAQFKSFHAKAEELNAWCDDYVKSGKFDKHKNK